MNTDSRLNELIDLHLDGGLSPANAVELEAALGASTEAQVAFWGRARLHSALRIAAQEQRGKTLAREPEPAPPVGIRRPKVSVRPPSRRVSISRRKKSRFSWGMPLALAAVVTISAVVIWKNFALSRVASSSEIATLIRAADAVWEDSDSAPAPGETLKAGWLRLKAGAIQVGFSRGARVVIEGPAEFLIVSENEGRLGFGKLWAHVPPAARGFTVRAREFAAVDLGTEFGCSVPLTGPAELHVFEGEVELREKAGTQPMRENQALEISDAGNRAIPARRGDFLEESELPEEAGFLRGIRTEQDLGNPAMGGSTSLDRVTGVWTVAGGGVDIYGASDEGHFVSQEFDGDGTLIARVASSQVSDGYSKSGVMWRESNTADSPYAFVFVGPNTLAYEVRTASGTATAGASYGPGSAPKWLKLTRVGQVFTAFASDDGSAWAQLGAAQELPMSPAARAGLAVTAHNPATLTVSTFENVSAHP
ncbi:MAG: hypothetical protein V4689_20295 [Verrucomicrobiota bacterium]